jgi:thiol:disulfide interchange protein
MSHAVKMALGCVLPMVAIFLLPLLGVGEGISLFVFVVLMFACHLFMMAGHREENRHKASETPRQGGHHARP